MVKMVRTYKAGVNKEFIPSIVHGFKTIDMRPYMDEWLNLQVGDKILYNRHYMVKVTGIIYYESPTELTENEDLTEIVPIQDDDLGKFVRHLCYRYVRKSKDKGLFAIHFKYLGEK